MRNKIFPRYPDDNDYTTNAPSYYEDLARKQKLIQLLAEKIWDYDDEIKEYFKRWEDNLETINEDVIEMMIQWLDDGTLDHIINDTIFNWKADKTYVDDEIERLDQFVDTEIERLDQEDENLTTHLTQTDEKLEFKTPYVSIEEFGAVGDWNSENKTGTDNTQAVIEAIDSVSSSGGTVIVPNKEYMITNTIDIPQGVIVKGIGNKAELVFNGERSVKYVIIMRSNTVLESIRISSSYETWDLQEPLSGIVLYDSDQSNLKNFYVINFEKGVHLIGDTRGTAYNTIYPTMLLNNYYHIYLENFNVGWVNQNSFFGGRLATYSERESENTYGVYMDQGNNHFINGNTFYSPSIEGSGTQFHICGMYNYAFNPRLENAVSGTAIEFADTESHVAQYNGIIGYYGQLPPKTNAIKTILKTGEAVNGSTSNYIFGRSHQLLLDSGLSLHSFRDVTIKYDLSLDAVIFKRNDINREFLKISTNGVDFLGLKTKNLRIESGETSVRPTALEGMVFFDKTLGKPIFANGSYWVDAMGERIIG